MKKFIYIFLIILLIITFISCTVNESTGLIKVENFTHIDLTNVKIGDTSIAWIVSGGGYVNYWYYETLKGKLTTEGIPVHSQFKDIDFKLYTGWYVYITAKYMDDGSEYVVIYAEKHNSTKKIYLD